MHQPPSSACRSHPLHEVVRVGRGHRILEQATRGSLRPKCLKEAAGRAHLVSAYLIAGRIGVQHEPFVTGPLAQRRFRGQGWNTPEEERRRT